MCPRQRWLAIRGCNGLWLTGTTNCPVLHRPLGGTRRHDRRRSGQCADHIQQRWTAELTFLHGCCSAILFRNPSSVSASLTEGTTEFHRRFRRQRCGARAVCSTQRVSPASLRSGVPTQPRLVRCYDRATTDQQGLGALGAENFTPNSYPQLAFMSLSGWRIPARSACTPGLPAKYAST
jgi:hypothetical protein